MTLTCALFAGGESCRMGADKATLQLVGEPLWARQIKILRELEPVALWVSARTPPVWCPLEIEVITDEPPSRGPLSGLCAALKKMRTTHLLALAVDLPRMEAGHLKNLWSRARKNCGVLPVNGDYVEPLCAIYPDGEFVVEAARRALAGNNFSLQHFTQVLIEAKLMEVVHLSETDRGSYLNVNTPEELARAVP